MANREALRELQTRLATRLQEAKAGAASASWLAVEAAGERYLLPLSQAGEIFPLASPQVVPYTQRWFLGVCNLRGALFGVVDVGAFISQSVPTARTDMTRDEARLVAFNPVLDINCVLLVDRLAGLRGTQTFASSELAPAGSPDYFGGRYTDPDGQAWQEINLQLLSQQARFLSISV